MVFPIVKYVESHGLDPCVLTRNLPIDVAYLKNPRNWLSRDAVVEIFYRCEELFDDPLITYKIGLRAFDMHEGTLAAFSKLLLTPSILVKFGPAILSFTCRFFRAKISWINRNEVRVIMNYLDKRMAHRHGCYYNMGWIAGLPRSVWNTHAWVQEEETPVEEELESIKKSGGFPSISNNVKFGSDRCAYRLKWVEPRYAGAVKKFLEENEDLIAQALAAIENKELTLQEKEFRLWEIEQVQNTREHRKKEVFENKGLTKREQEIVNLVIQGLNNYEIAERLVISTETVKKHLSNVFNKMEVNTRSALTAKVYELIH